MISITVACVLLSNVATASIWYVRADALAGGDGTTWASAFQTIQPAVDAAAGDTESEVWVAAGTYFGGSDPLHGALLILEGVALYGGFSGTEVSREERDWEKNATILEPVAVSAEEFGAAAVGIRARVVLDGFSIQHAKRYGVFSAGRCDQAVIANCTVKDNGVGPYRFESEGLGLTLGALVGGSIRNCIISGNSGGGLRIRNSRDSRIEQCSFSDNGILDSTSLPALSAQSSRAEITDCTFTANLSGALGIHANDGVHVTRSVFVENRSALGAIFVSPYGNSKSVKGSLDNFAGYSQITNCLFLRNEATADETLATGAGAIQIYAGYFIPDEDLAGVYYPFWIPPVISNCTFVDNTFNGAPRAVYSALGILDVPIFNCAFVNNGIGYNPAGSFIFDEFELVAGNVYPERASFVDPDMDDYRLLPDSPCVDAGINTASAAFGNVLTDIRGVARTRLHDVGAYELDAPRIHNADTNGDFQIGLSELLRVVQFYNLLAYHCAVNSEDGFWPGPGAVEECLPHASDFAPQDWSISLEELLRTIQLYNSPGFTPCEEGEDGFCVSKRAQS
jgi:parallel beta-helix repeat protein